MLAACKLEYSYWYSYTTNFAQGLEGDRQAQGPK